MLVVEASNRPLEDETDVLTSCHVVPSCHCHFPCVVAFAELATTTIPARLLALEPPLTVSVESLKAVVTTELTVTPVAEGVSSVTEGTVAVAAAIVGASLLAVTASVTPVVP